jgi:hypothetical protein
MGAADHRQRVLCSQTCLSSQQSRRPHEKANGFAFVPGYAHRVEPAEQVVPLPARALSPTQKVYLCVAAIKATKPTRLPHGNLTNCDVIADL